LLRYAWCILLLTTFSGCWFFSSDSQEKASGVEKKQAPPVREGAQQKPGLGKWRRVRSAASLSPAQQAEIEALEALGYVAGSVERESANVVTVHQEDKTSEGLNFYCSGHASEAKLVDMRGKELHSWRAAFHEVWPKHSARVGASGTHHFRRAKVLENGDLFAVFEGRGILRMDRDSRVLWAKDNRAHHDLDFLPNGDLVVLTREASVIPRLNPNKPILEDFLTVLGPDGEEKSRVSILEALENSEFRSWWRRGKAPKGDVFHTNTVFVIPEGFSSTHEAFQAGRVLSSSRALNLIFVVDLDEGRVVWGHRGGFRKQHDPRLVKGGGLLLFDNVGRKSGSRVLEYEPTTMEPKWSYAGTKSQPFLSKTLGTAHRLANGNTLVTESEGGRAFELSATGEIVWEFFNPHRAGPDDEYIAALFEMTRLPTDFGSSWLQDSVPQQ
jgi:hypothetical protein